MFLKLDNGMTFKFVDQVDDIQVLSDNGFKNHDQEWFSVNTFSDENFKGASKRIAKRLSKERGSAIFFSTKTLFLY